MLQFKRNLLSAALASAIVMAATGARAQTTQVSSGSQEPAATELDPVITGIRRGMENAIETKERDSRSSSTISAKDIGKLPTSASPHCRSHGPARRRARHQHQYPRVFSTISGPRCSTAASHAATSRRRVRPVSFRAGQRGRRLQDADRPDRAGPVPYPSPDGAPAFNAPTGRLGRRPWRTQLARPANPGSTAYGNRVSASSTSSWMAASALGFAHLDSPGQSNRWESWGYPQEP